MEFKLPDLGENIESGDVVALLVKVGDRIEPQQSVLELETDKAVIEVPSSLGGLVQEIHARGKTSRRAYWVTLSRWPWPGRWPPTSL